MWWLFIVKWLTGMSNKELFLASLPLVRFFYGLSVHPCLLLSGSCYNALVPGGKSQRCGLYQVCVVPWQITDINFGYFCWQLSRPMSMNAPHSRFNQRISAMNAPHSSVTKGLVTSTELGNSHATMFQCFWSIRQGMDSNILSDQSLVVFFQGL